MTSGGRVFCAVGLGATVKAAQRDAYAIVDAVQLRRRAVPARHRLPGHRARAGFHEVSAASALQRAARSPAASRRGRPSASAPDAHCGRRPQRACIAAVAATTPALRRRRSRTHERRDSCRDLPPPLRRPLPSRPSSTTPATSGAHCRAQDWARDCAAAPRERQECAASSPSAANTAVEAPTDWCAGAPSSASIRFASPAPSTVSSQALPVPICRRGEIADRSACAEIHHQVHDVQMQRQRSERTPPLPALHLPGIQRAAHEGVRAPPALNDRERDQHQHGNVERAAEPGVRMDARRRRGLQRSRPATQFLFVLPQVMRGECRLAVRNAYDMAARSRSPISPAMPSADSMNARSSHCARSGERKTSIRSGVTGLDMGASKLNSTPGEPASGTGLDCRRPDRYPGGCSSMQQEGRVPHVSARTVRRVRRVLGLLQAVSPRLAARVAFTLFLTPARRAFNPADAEYRLARKRIHGRCRFAHCARLRVGRGAAHRGDPARLGLACAAIRTAGARPRGGGWRVLAIDAPGHGESPGRRSSLPEFRLALDAVLGQTGPAQVLIGHSLGALAIALRLGETASAPDPALRAAVLHRDAVGRPVPDPAVPAAVRDP